MAADLDLTAAPPAAAPKVGRWLGLGLAGVVLVAVVVLTGWAAVALLACVVAGAGLTYLSGLALTLEERLAYGTVIGAVVVTMADLLLALAFGLGLATALAGLAVALAASAPGWWLARGRLTAESDDLIARWTRRQPWPLWALLAVCWPFTLAVLARTYALTSQGLIAGGTWSYADWAAHLTYAGSFVYGHNFPPQFPVDPGHRLAYPFMIDLLAASLVPLGTSLTSALVLSSGLLALAFPAVMYLAGVRLVASRGASALAVLVFTLSGGLGFVLVLQDVARGGLDALQRQTGLLTQNPDVNIQWLNPVLAWLLPQRSILFGLSLALLVMALLWVALQATDAPSPSEGEGWGGVARRWAPFAFAGAVAGLTPLFHLHAYGTIVALSAFWAVFSRRREWLAFFGPALVLGAPAVLWMLGGGAATLHVQVWWLADSGGHHDSPVWFWLRNTSLVIPAMIVAFVWRGVLPARAALYLAPIWLWFVVPNFLVFQPWDWDNTKFFAYWLLFGSLAVGALLVRLVRSGPEGRVVAVALFLSLVVSGAVDLGRAVAPGALEAQFTDAGGVAVANWARANTDPGAIFLVAPAHNEPIPTLGGRRVMVGYGGWLWTYGLADWGQKTADAQRMLRGDPATPALLQKYGVTYVVIGPQELSGVSANPAYFDGTAQRVYSSGGYTVYRVR
ncbi:MAG TPA: hypothetical protein VOB72_00040 [Candidatus Dormibacteraeota bacterium]|nr:hypothetical protein [Candidatus Dormibacteraeota bacterium]